ncbi:MAG: hypothetical protein ACRELX_00635, partial [Longimicrobiales bacterium]
MSLVLAIEPDPRQATRLEDLMRTRVGADLVQADTTERALAAIGNRVPDLILVPSLLSPQEDVAIAGALRLIATAANVRMLTIPLLADPEQPAKPRGVFGRWRKVKAGISNGCAPAVFATQISEYLAAAAESAEHAEEAELPPETSAEPVEAIESVQPAIAFARTSAPPESAASDVLIPSLILPVASDARIAPVARLITADPVEPSAEAADIEP